MDAEDGSVKIDWSGTVRGLRGPVGSSFGPWRRKVSGLGPGAVRPQIQEELETSIRRRGRAISGPARTQKRTWLVHEFQDRATPDRQYQKGQVDKSNEIQFLNCGFSVKFKCLRESVVNTEEIAWNTSV